MAEAASSKKKQQQQHSTLCGQNITDCLLEPDDEDDDNNDHDDGGNSNMSLPVTLRIFFDPSKHLAFFRLYTTICCDVNSRPTPTQLFLDIVPDKIHMLSLSRPRLRLRFRLIAPGSIIVIAPTTIPLGQLKPAIPSAQAALRSLRHLSQLSAIRIALDRVVVQDLDLDLPLQACCEALSAQHLFVIPLHPDPIHTSLRSLYRGAGGRVVQVDKELPAPLPLDPPASPPAAPPPAYDDDVSTTLDKNKGKNKRLRTHSPTTSSSTSPSPDRTTFGQREKRMAELIRYADERHAALTKLLIETESATLDLQATLKNATARQRCGSDKKGGEVEETEEEEENATASIASLAAPSVPAQTPAIAPASSPAAASTSSTTTSSRASTLSDRFQTLITPHLDRLRNEITAMLQGYVTVDDVDAILTDNRFVREEAMFEAIEQVVEENMDQVRDRIRDAFL